MANLVVHFEIHASDPQALIDFYTELFGWRFGQYGDLSYWAIETGNGSVSGTSPGYGINGGLVQRQGGEPEAGDPVNGCNLVIAVDDIDAVFTQALALGATVAMALDDMPSIGRLGYLLDPDNNVFGLISAVLSDGTSVTAQL